MTNFLTYLIYELYKFLICFWNKSESHLNFWSSFYLISLYYLLYFSDNWQFLITKDFIAFNNNDKFDLTILEQLKDTKFCIFLIFFYIIKTLTNVLDAARVLTGRLRDLNSPSLSSHYPECPEKYPWIDRPHQPSETTLVRAFDLSCLGFPHGFIDRPLSFPLRYRWCGAFHTHTNTYMHPWFVRNINAIVHFPLRTVPFNRS